MQWCKAQTWRDQHMVCSNYYVYVERSRRRRRVESSNRSESCQECKWGGIEECWSDSQVTFCVQIIYLDLSARMVIDLVQSKPNISITCCNRTLSPSTLKGGNFVSFFLLPPARWNEANLPVPLVERMLLFLLMSWKIRRTCVRLLYTHLYFLMSFFKGKKAKGCISKWQGKEVVTTYGSSRATHSGLLKAPSPLYKAAMVTTLFLVQHTADIVWNRNFYPRTRFRC